MTRVSRLQSKVPAAARTEKPRRAPVSTSLAGEPRAAVKSEKDGLLSGGVDDPDEVADVVAAALELVRFAGCGEALRYIAAYRRSPTTDAPDLNKKSAPEMSVCPESLEQGGQHRWLEMRTEFLADHKSVTAPELARHTGSRAKNKSARAHDWVKAGRIFSIHDGAAELYPLFQLREGRPIPELTVALGLLLPKLSSWQIAIWFTTANAWTGEWRTPAELLMTNPLKVIEAARQEVTVQEF